MPQKYNLKVINKSGEPQTVGVYQDYPGLQGLSLVWFSKYIVSTTNEKGEIQGNNHQFEWSINWGLGWGTTPALLAAGVTFKSSGAVQSVEPSPMSTNGIQIGYSSVKNDGDFTQVAIKDSGLKNGQLRISTTDDFSISQATHMSVAVHMDGKAAFAMHGKPNGNYLIDTHPHYYLAVTDEAISTAISGSYVSSPREVAFENIFEVTCELNDHLSFNCHNGIDA